MIQQEQSTNSTFKVLFGLLGQFRLEYVGLVLISSMLSGVEGIFQPLLVKSIFDEGVIKRDFSRFVILAGSYVILGLLINLTRTGTALWGKSFENRIVK